MAPKLRFLLAAAVAFLLLGVARIWLPVAEAAPAQDCSVPGDFSTIQDALNDEACETISVGAGVFQENVTINRSVTISGQGTAGTEVNGGAAGSVFAIGTENMEAVVLLSNMTVANGSANFGGGIINEAKLTLSNTALTANSAVLGGGILNAGSLTVENSMVLGNLATETLFNIEGRGGGIYNASGTVAMSGTVLGRNTGVVGGGIYNADTLTIDNSTLSDNTTFGLGGAIFNESSVSIGSSTLSANFAPFAGGGIYNQGELVINNSTLSGNQAANDVVGSMGGGGIYNAGGYVTIANSTLAENYTDLYGHAVASYGGQVTFKNSIVASAADPDDNNCQSGEGADFKSEGYNLDSGDTCNFMAAGDIVNETPQLGPLQDSGGETFTHALPVSSPAIDAGSCADLSVDQRDLPRPIDIPGAGNAADSCDIGAFEARDFFAAYMPLI